MTECDSTSRCGSFNIAMKCGREENHVGNHQAFVPNVYKRQGMDAVFVWDTRLLSTSPVLPDSDWTHECEECGIKVEDRIPVCFYCKYWLDTIKECLEDGIRIDGAHYVAASASGGFGGQEFVIEYFDDRPTLKTNSLWLQGKIPAHFQDRLPNNAKFEGDSPCVV